MQFNSARPRLPGTRWDEPSRPVRRLAAVVATPGRRRLVLVFVFLTASLGVVPLALRDPSPRAASASSGTGAPTDIGSPQAKAPGGSTSTVGSSAAGPAASPPTINQTWSVTLDDAGAPIAESSPNVAQLPGGPAVVVGDRKGFVYAYYLAGSAATPVAGWPFADGGAPIDSTPSVARLSGADDTVFVGEGNAAEPYVGGYAAIAPTGQSLWFTPEHNPPTDPFPRNGVQASLAVGNLRGGTDVVAGSLGQEEYALDAANGAVLPGFPWIEADSNFSTPALADLNHDGVTEIIEGGASTAGAAFHRQYSNGGHLRVLAPVGDAGKAHPNQAESCVYDTDQEVDSSPAVGEFLGSQTIGIVVGTGNYYSGAPQTDQLIAFNISCQPMWAATLAGLTSSSPALADVVGNGQLQVVEGTNDGSSGTVYVLDGATGVADWLAHTSAPVFGSVVTADLFGDGQDVLVPTTNGVDVFNHTGQLVTTLAPWNGFQNSPLVTEDPNGTVGITVAGYNGDNKGVIFHYEVAGSKGSQVDDAGSWPMFHHDPQLTGNAGTPFNLQIPCSAPAQPAGYRQAGADGAVFSFGNLPYCGSTSGIRGAAPVTAIASTRDGGGYWLVSSDGGVFSFGDSKFFGNLSGRPLSAPVVGITATPDGGGYWLVSSDGGVFGFGDARFLGNLSGRPLSAPVVGIISTRDGGGYWLVSSDGGVFGFGDARFLGNLSGRRLTAPVVGMALTPDGGGYWLVSSDGGVFGFGDAGFYGSSSGRPLAAPVVGMKG